MVITTIWCSEQLAAMGHGELLKQRFSEVTAFTTVIGRYIGNQLENPLNAISMKMHDWQLRQHWMKITEISNEAVNYVETRLERVFSPLLLAQQLNNPLPKGNQIGYRLSHRHQVGDRC